MRTAAIAFAGLISSAVAPAAMAQGLFDPWADRVVDYAEGSEPAVGFTDPLTTLGPPERFTGEGVFPGAVTPFNPPFGRDELVSIGAGGFLVVEFDEPVTDDATNPFGIDLLVFSNALYTDASFPDGLVSGIFAEGGTIEVSADGVEWFLIDGVAAAGPNATLGYLDLTGPYDPSAGSVPSDFTKPVDPTLDPIGLNFVELVAAYDGSGGGVGVAIATVGLSEISFVRIASSSGSPEIDAFADVAATCPPDIDGDGFLTVFDFLEFQNRFVTGDARADFDASGALDLFDFLAFQDAYTTGCP